VNFDSGHMKAYFIKAFMIFGFLIAFVGSFAIERFSQSQAIKNENILIPVNRLAPWMSAIPVCGEQCAFLEDTRDF